MFGTVPNAKICFHITEMNYSLVENKVDSIKKYFKMSLNIYFVHKNLPVKFLHQLQFQRVPWGATLLQCENNERNMSLQKCHKHMKSKKYPLNLMEEELLFQPIRLLDI